MPTDADNEEVKVQQDANSVDNPKQEETTTTTTTTTGDSSSKINPEFQALMTGYDTKVLDLESKLVTLPVSKDKVYYKLVDTDRVVRSLKSDHTLYNQDKEDWTMKGRRRLAAVESIRSAQRQGYRFVPTKNGGFTVVDDGGNPLSIPESPTQGQSNMDRGVLSLVNGDTSRHKSVSNIMGNVMSGNLYQTDPEYTKAQKIFTDNAALERDITRLKGRKQSIYDAYLLGRGETSSSSTVTKTIKDIIDDGNGVNGPKGENDDSVEKDLENDAKKSFDTSGWSWESTFGTNTILPTIASTGLITSIATKGKLSDYALLTGLTADTLDSLFNEDRSFARTASENLGVLALSVFGLGKQKKKKFLVGLARSISNKGVNGAKMMNSLGKASKWLNGLNMAGALGSMAIQSIQSTEKILKKYRSGESFNERDVLEVVYLLSQIGVIAKSKVKWPKKKTAISPTPTPTPTPTPASKPVLRLGPGTPPAPTSNPTLNLPVSSPTLQLPQNLQPGVKGIPLPSSNGIMVRRDGGIVYELHPSVYTSFKDKLQKFSNGGRLVPKAQNSGQFYNMYGMEDLNTATNNYQQNNYDAVINNDTPVAASAPPVWTTDPNQANPSVMGNLANNEVIGGTPASLDPVAKKKFQELKTEWELSGETVDTENLPFIYSLSVDDNWEDVRDNGAEPSGNKMMVYMDKKNPNTFIDEDNIDKYLRKNYRDEYRKARAKHSGENKGTPFFTGMGAVYGAVPYGAITSAIINEKSRRNVHTVDYADLKKTPISSMPVFAAKETPFEVKQEQNNAIKSAALSARSMSSDPLANMEQARRISSMELKQSNTLRSEIANYARNQINRQEDQEIAAHQDRARQVAANVNIDNENIKGRLRADNLNAEMKVKAHQEYLNNIQSNLQSVFDHNINRSRAISDAEYEDAMLEVQMYKQQLAAEFSREDGPRQSQVDILKVKIRELSNNAINAQRHRQAGASIKPSGVFTSKAVDKNKIGTWTGDRFK